MIVKDVLNYFNYRVVTGDEQAFQRPVTVLDVVRPGLELCGYYEYSKMKRIFILGDKEIHYIDSLTEQQQKERFDYLTNEETPFILIARDHMCPPVLEDIAKKKNFPVFSSYATTSSLMVELMSFLEEQLAPSVSVHGVLMNLYGTGVLIKGKSSMGKSEIALELIQKGHLLVSDDRVDIKRVHNTIQGEAPDIIRDMLEVRGVGILNIVDLYGVHSTMPKCRLDFIVELEQWNPLKDYTRVGIEENIYETYFGIPVPKLILPVSGGRSIATIIESAVVNYMLKKRGLNSSQVFEDKVIQFILSRKDED